MSDIENYQGKEFTKHTVHHRTLSQTVTSRLCNCFEEIWNVSRRVGHGSPRSTTAKDSRYLMPSARLTEHKILLKENF